MKPLSGGSVLLERKVLISYESEMPRRWGGGTQHENLAPNKLQLKG